MPITIKVPVSLQHTLAADGKAGDVITVTGTVEHEVPQEVIDRCLGSRFKDFAEREKKAEEETNRVKAELDALKSGGSPEFTKKLAEAVAAKESELKSKYESELKAEQAKVLKASAIAELGGKLLPAYAASVTTEAGDTAATVKAKVEAALKQQEADLAAAGVTKAGTGAGFNGNGAGGSTGATEDAKLIAWSQKYYPMHRGMKDAQRIEIMKSMVSMGLFDVATGQPVKR